MITSLKYAAATLLVALCVASASSLEIIPTTTKVLLSYGEAMATVTVMAPEGSDSPSVSTSSLYTVGTITSGPAEDGMTNYTIPLSMEAGVGKDDITVTVGDESVSGTVIVAGVVIKDGLSIVSGDNNDGVTVGVEGTYSFDVDAVGTDGQTVDVSGATIEGMATSGTYMKQLNSSSTSLTSSSFVLGINRYRTSSVPFKVTIEIPTIEYNGEVFETSLKVAQDPTTAPCAAIGGTYTSTDGVVVVDMYNVPNSADSVTISGPGGATGSLNTEKSDFTMPDQKIAFNYAVSGEVTFKCSDDSDDAYITHPGTATVTVSSSEEELAKDFLQEVDEVEGKDQLTARISILASSPDTLSKAEAYVVLGKFCNDFIGSPIGDQCNLEEVTAGSAVCKMAGNIPSGSGPEIESSLKTNINDCTFQKDIGEDCGYLMLIQTQVNAIGGATSPVAAGLATWTIVLIAGLGAFALIVLIMLGLLAVYRRSAEQSESDYSSSGPLGVPDPSDLLYEQSIVRDIYGRGDFPDGGPSAAVAEQREREAALREEFPRPPSSSGLSRGSVTDDASSTYSV